VQGYPISERQTVVSAYRLEVVQCMLTIYEWPIPDEERVVAVSES